MKIRCVSCVLIAACSVHGRKTSRACAPRRFAFTHIEGGRSVLSLLCVPLLAFPALCPPHGSLAPPWFFLNCASQRVAPESAPRDNVSGNRRIQFSSNQQ